MTRLSAQPRAVALIVAAAMFMQLLDGVIIVTALPAMARSFGVQPLEMSVGVTIYMLAAAIFMPLAGWLADRHGPRAVFLGAILLFTVASLACGLAQTLGQFVAARIVQGIGGAFMVPVGRILVLRSAQKSELVHAIALITWPALIAPVIGPFLGGAITTYASWRWNFLINLPLGLIGLLLVLRFVPATRPSAPRPLDTPGFLLSALGLAGLLYGLESSIHSGHGPAVTAALVAGGLLFSLLAVRHLARAAHPLLDLSPVRIETFAVASLFSGTWYRAAINAMPFLLPLFFQLAFGLNAVEAGALVIVYFAGNLAMKSVTTPILRRFGFRRLLFVNGVLGALSMAVFALFDPQTPMPILLFALFVAGLTRSMQFTALNTLAFADIDAAQRSSASTLSSMLQQIAMFLGIAVAAAMLNASHLLAGRGEPALADFAVTFLGIGLVALLATLRVLRLPASAGEEVSGHRASPAA